MSPAVPSWQGPTDDLERLRAVVDRWAAATALDELVAAFGGVVPSLTGSERLRWLDSFSAAHWDFRRGRERNLADAVALEPAQERLVLALAPELGLADIHQPSRARYESVLMTGGMIRAGIVKPRFVAELLDAGLDIGTVTFLGGFRDFAGDEIELARALGVRGDNEFDAMVAGMELAFGPLGEPEVEEFLGESSNASWCEYSWQTGSTRLSVIAAPSSAPKVRRANTADTYRFWAEHRRANVDSSVLLVTTPIYVPYQGAGAVEILGLDYGLAVETVGVSATASDLGEYSQPFLPRHHLQELRAAIGAMLSLRARL
ncbi:hypothetical protein [Glaciihabitans sp. UYNi722]|uniref:hypothetical protein n=1 Tax=Glaciihabitans sp. UYNi722 TaxID=3156344 RepID=UPI00339B6C99